MKIFTVPGIIGQTISLLIAMAMVNAIEQQRSIKMFPHPHLNTHI